MLLKFIIVATIGLAFFCSQSYGRIGHNITKYDQDKELITTFLEQNFLNVGAFFLIPILSIYTALECNEPHEEYSDCGENDCNDYTCEKPTRECAFDCLFPTPACVCEERFRRMRKNGPCVPVCSE